jgi:sphingomyelin phosphodiesterase 2
VPDVDGDAPDPKAKRLDYVFFADNAQYTGQEWAVEELRVGMTMRHPTLQCSLSDHFSIETTLVRRSSSTQQQQQQQQKQKQNPLTTTNNMIHHLPPATYELIQQMIAQYDLRERRQRKWRIAHFFAAFTISLGCLVAVWWSPRNFVAFLLMLLSTLGLAAGVVDGLMGFLFVGSELRALRVFAWEIDMAVGRARRGVELGDDDGSRNSDGNRGNDGSGAGSEEHQQQQQEQDNGGGKLLDAEIASRDDIEAESGIERMK